MFRSLSLILCAAALAAPSAAKEKALEASEAAAGMTIPTFETFRLAPGKTEAFIRDMALWDTGSVAGGQPPTQHFLKPGGGGGEGRPYNPERTTPKPDQTPARPAKDDGRDRQTSVEGKGGSARVKSR